MHQRPPVYPRSAFPICQRQLMAGNHVQDATIQFLIYFIHQKAPFTEHLDSIHHEKTQYVHQCKRQVSDIRFIDTQVQKHALETVHIGLTKRPYLEFTIQNPFYLRSKILSRTMLYVFHYLSCIVSSTSLYRYVCTDWVFNWSAVFWAQYACYCLQSTRNKYPSKYCSSGLSHLIKRAEWTRCGRRKSLSR